MGRSRHRDIHWADDCEKAIRLLEASADGLTLTGLAHQGGWTASRARELLDDLKGSVATKIVRRNGEPFHFYFLNVGSG